MHAHIGRINGLIVEQIYIHGIGTTAPVDVPIEIRIDGANACCLVRNIVSVGCWVIVREPHAHRLGIGIARR